MKWRLVDADGKEVPIGSELVDHRGERWTLTRYWPPEHDGSTGRVWITDWTGNSFYPHTKTLYAQVFGLEYVRVEGKSTE